MTSRKPPVVDPEHKHKISNASLRIIYDSSKVSDTASTYLVVSSSKRESKGKLEISCKFEFILKQ
jgi:hypothetical protein